MSVLIIRAHKRFAVRRKARLRRPGRKGEEGLLIELSLEGCRISNLDPRAFAVDQNVTLRVEGARQPFAGRIRWRSDGTIGLRFLQPLHAAVLDRLIRHCRGEDAGPALAPLRAYGT